MKFTELDLDSRILQALEDIQYTDLTPIQEQTMPHILAGRDLVALAQTGSGKTSACGVPLVQMIDENLNAIQGLILVPTRELAQQYVDEIYKLSRLTKVIPFAMFGGHSMEIQSAKIRHGVHILVATPGRLIDFIYNSEINFTKIRTVVLDEADEMLKMGFIEDVSFIISCLIHEHQTLLFSATMPDPIMALVKDFLRDPIRVELIRAVSMPESLEHVFTMVGHRNRQPFLQKYLETEKVKQSIIFCNSRKNGDILLQQMRSRVDRLDMMHGGMDQPKRNAIVAKFRRGEIQHLIATDVVGRGLDFSNVTHVINFDYPPTEETYVHRTGRAGRMGRQGKALTMVDQRNILQLQSLLKMHPIKPSWIGPPPREIPQALVSPVLPQEPTPQASGTQG